MKVAYIVSRFPTASETFIVRELNGLAELGVELELRSLYPPKDAFAHPSAEAWVGRLQRPGVGAGMRGLGYWLMRRPLRLLRSIGTVIAGSVRKPEILARSLVTIPAAAAHARSLESSGAGHVHAHFANYPALVAWLAARLTGLPYSFTAHAHDLFVHQVLLAAKVEEAAFVAAISEYDRRFLRDYGGDSTTPVHVVHCGVDPGAYEFRPRAIPARGPVRALCVATLQEKKGHAVLLDAIAGSDGLARLELDLVGDGPRRDALRGRVRELGLDDRVRFHGSLPEPEVRRLLGAADMFVLPSVVASDGQMEGLPVALIEALACGVPAVSTRLSGIPELIEDGVTGLLAEPGDAASLRGRIAELLEGSAQLDAARGRRLVEAEFDSRESARRMKELFELSRASGR